MRHALKALFLALLLLPLSAQAQQLTAVPPPSYSPEQIDQMTAPIALYPDQLIGQILMASTYPLEVVEATRWRQDPQNAALTGDALQAALDQQPWDPSVKSLIMFPQVLTMMNSNLQWTEQLGDAFLAEQPTVMDSIQRLRGQAQAAGSLQSTPQQTVTGTPGDIVIAPSNPQVVYVPTYNPQVVYGTWAYPQYPPYYFAPAPGYVYTNYGLFGFATGIVIADWFWNWDHWDWYHHRIDIDRDRFEVLNRGRVPRFSGDTWEHNPSHRHGVPYTNSTVRSQFQPAADEARRNFRGFAPRTSPNVTGSSNTRMLPQTAPSVTGNQSFHQSSVAGSQALPRQNSVNAAGRPFTNSPSRAPQQPQTEQRSSPVFESFSRPNVREQSQRGAYSRAAPVARATPATAPRAAPPRAAAAPARSQPHAGGGGGDQRGGDGRNDHNR